MKTREISAFPFFSLLQFTSVVEFHKMNTRITHNRNLYESTTISLWFVWIERNHFTSKQKQVQKRIIQNTFSNHFSRCVETHRPMKKKVRDQVHNLIWNHSLIWLLVLCWKFLIKVENEWKNDESMALGSKARRWNTWTASKFERQKESDMEDIKSDRENAYECLCV